jgi:hypothetical protein
LPSLGRTIHSVVQQIVKRTTSQIKDLIEQKAGLKEGLSLAIGKELSEAIKAIVAEATQKVQDNVEFNRSLELDKDLNKSSLVLKLKYKGTERVKKFIVHDVIPKSFSNSSATITVTASGANITVIVTDPEYLITYNTLEPNEEKTITYSVNKLVDGSVINSTSSPNIFAESLEAVTPIPTELILIIIIVIVAAVALFLVWKYYLHGKITKNI